MSRKVFLSSNESVSFSNKNTDIKHIDSNLSILLTESEIQPSDQLYTSWFLTYNGAISFDFEQSLTNHTPVCGAGFVPRPHPDLLSQLGLPEGQFFGWLKLAIVNSLLAIALGYNGKTYIHFYDISSLGTLGQHKTWLGNKWIELDFTVSYLGFNSLNPNMIGGSGYALIVGWRNQNGPVAETFAEVDETTYEHRTHYYGLPTDSPDDRIEDVYEYPTAEFNNSNIFLETDFSGLSKPDTTPIGFSGNLDIAYTKAGPFYRVCGTDYKGRPFYTLNTDDITIDWDKQSQHVFAFGYMDRDSYLAHYSFILERKPGQQLDYKVITDIDFPQMISARWQDNNNEVFIRPASARWKSYGDDEQTAKSCDACKECVKLGWDEAKLETWVLYNKSYNEYSDAVVKNLNPPYDWLRRYGGSQFKIEGSKSFPQVTPYHTFNNYRIIKGNFRVDQVGHDEIVKPKAEINTIIRETYTDKTFRVYTETNIEGGRDIYTYGFQIAKSMPTDESFQFYLDDDTTLGVNILQCWIEQYDDYYKYIIQIYHNAYIIDLFTEYLENLTYNNWFGWNGTEDYPHHAFDMKVM